MLVVTRFILLCALVLALPAVATALPPTAPADMTVGAISTTAIKLEWSDSPDETGFEVFNGNETRRVGAGVTNYVWGGMTPGQYMCFRVRSFNGSGFSPWVPADAPYYWCAVTPRSRAELLAFPISGNSHIGFFGLHDHNFLAVTDDKALAMPSPSQTGVPNQTIAIRSIL